ncbi:MAG: RNA polymerase sigma factor [Chitinophagales bacterium]|nr:RNA polymerase sigma factor [Bacteroidota bacterium]MCB9042433.1 RNA polymerase sigma factor [Chitinophagales bacterium]
MTEQELIRACVQKNKAAEKELYLRYSSKVMATCLRYARNSADAEDIMQDVFVRIYDALPQFKYEGSFIGWMRRIVFTIALRKYQRFLYKHEKYNIEAAANIPTDNMSIFDQLSLEELFHLIQKLPDGYRMVFNLYVIEGYTHEEIAKMLTIDAGTSRSQLYKARQLLQSWILAMQKINL